MNDMSCKTPDPQLERLNEAAMNLEKILKKIKPYANVMEVEEYSTSGKWQTIDGKNIGPAMTHDVFDSILKRVGRPVNEPPRVE